jgi:hypothetical protein
MYKGCVLLMMNRAVLTVSMLKCVLEELLCLFQYREAGLEIKLK